MPKAIDESTATDEKSPDHELYGHHGLSAQEIQQLAVLEPQSIHMEWSACPVHRMEGGGVLVTGMRRISRLVRSDDILGPSATAPVLGTKEPVIPLELDGPEHRKYRRLLDPIFSPRRVAAWEPEIRQLADELIDGFIDDGHVEVYEQFCQVLPARIFLRLMGLPLEEFDDLVIYKEEIVRFDPKESPDDALERKTKVQERFHAKMTEHIEARRTSGVEADDLLSELLRAKMDGSPLTDDTILHVCSMVVFAGLDTVAAALSLQLCWLALHPDERRSLTAAPNRWATAADELLRYETVVPVGRFYPTGERMIDDLPVEAGATLTVSWASANLDPEMFPDPLEVKLDRTPNPHATFGLGIHRCLGQHLARIELRSALEQFHLRIPDYQIAPGTELKIDPCPVRLIRPLPLVWH